MVNILLIIMCSLLYATAAFATGFFLIDRAKSKCKYPDRYGEHLNSCYHNWNLFWGLFWPVFFAAALVATVIYCLMLGPMKAGRWMANTANSWEWAK